MMQDRAAASVLRRACMLALASLLAACAGHPQKPVPAPAATAKTSVDTTHASKRPARKPWKPLGPYTPGGLYAPGVADGAPDVSADVANLPEPVPHAEALSHYGNRSPYVVLGKSYTVLPNARGYVERGVASWYGTKFDGRATSNFESYDMYEFTAAHRTLPLPSYARVTNTDNGRSVIVRVNDRGPFHEGRLIDLSYAAAIKLGVTAHGTANVEVRGIDPGEPLPPVPGISRVAPEPALTHLSVMPKRATPAPKYTVDAAKPAVAVDAIAAVADDAATSAVGPKEFPASVAPVTASAQNGTRAAAMIAISQTHSATMAPASAATDAATATAQSVIERPAIDASTHGFLQLASYGNRANAETMLQRVQKTGVEHAELVSVQVAGQTLWRVHVGPLRADQAEAVAEHLDAMGFGHPPFFKD